VLREIRDQRVTVAEFTPSLWEMVVSALAEGESAGASLRLLILGGEQVPAQALADWLRLTAVPVYNTYGPTEATITAVATLIEDGPSGTVPIGRPVENTRVFVVDRFGRLAPLGAPGELWIGGPGVARGYLKRPELTAERFVADGFGGSGRLYRSGDLVRWLPGGVLEFLGRVDEQVKIRGLRVELGEVRSVLAGVAGVGSAVVVVREDVPGDKRLAGYCVPVPGAVLDAEAVRGACAVRLPGYMVPQVVVVDAIPLTPNGKVDRAALPVPGGGGGGAGFTAPRTELEAAIAAVWAQVLGVDAVGIHDDFFALGGHSLLATRVVNRVEQLTGLEVSLRDFLLSPTVAALTARLIAAFAAEAASLPAAVAEGR